MAWPLRHMFCLRSLTFCNDINDSIGRIDVDVCIVGMMLISISLTNTMSDYGMGV